MIRSTLTIVLLVVLAPVVTFALSVPAFRRIATGQTLSPPTLGGDTVRRVLNDAPTCIHTDGR